MSSRLKARLGGYQVGLERVLVGGVNHGELLGPVGLVSEWTLPDPKAIVDEYVVASEDGVSGHHPSGGPSLTGYRLVWWVRPQQLQGLTFHLQGVDNSGAEVLVGGFRSVVRSRPGEGEGVQWRPQVLSKAVLTAGARLGVSGGLIDGTWRTVDTVSISQTYRIRPNPERILGPKDPSDGVTLSPDGTAASLLVDMMGLELGFVYVAPARSGTAATAILVEEWPL